MRVYIDGREDTGGEFPKALTGNINDSTQTLLIGNEGFAGRLWPGFIGAVSIYNRALSAAEIGSLYADPYQIWDVGDDAWEYAPVEAPAGGKPHYYYQMLSKRRAS